MQLPQFLFEAGYGNRGVIAITQPRRVAATSRAFGVAIELCDTEL
jgi:HrpA-like RNA helicase